MAQIHWLHAVNGMFSDAADWGGGVVPGASDDAILDATGGKFTVTARKAEKVESLQLSAKAHLVIDKRFTALEGTGAGENAGTINIDSGGTLAVGGIVNNTGLIALNQTSGYAELVVDATKVSLVGGGMITLSERSLNASAIVVARGAKLTNVDNTINGVGQVMVTVNDEGGVIDATVAAGTLYATVFVNDGLLEATSGGHLGLRRTIDNEGGVILAGAGSTVAFVDLNGGTLTGAGAFYARSGTLDGTSAPLTNAGTIDVGGLTLRGTIVNEGSIEIGPTGSIYFGDQVTLAGGGIVNLYNNLIGDKGSLRNIDNTLTGSGTLGGSGMTLANEASGVIAGSGMILYASAAVMTNAGLIEGTSGAGLTIRKTTIANSGTILSGAGSVVELLGADIQGGALEAGASAAVSAVGGGNMLDGTTHTVLNQATISIGGASTLTVEGAIVNSGAIGLVSVSSVLGVGAAGVTLSGGGEVSLVSATDLVEGVTSTSTLTNVDNVIQGSGQLGDGAMGLVNETAGTIEATNAAALVVNLGANTLVNAGIIEALGITAQETIAGAVANTGTLEAAGGTLAVDGAVTGSGEAVISAGTLAFTSSFNEAVDFDGTGGELQLAQSQGFTNTVTGFSTSAATSLDLLDIGFVGSGEATFSGTASGGTLSVTDGTHTAHIALAGDFVGDTFTAASDGTGGTSVVATGGAGGPTQLHWLTAVDGLFTDASDWTGGLVPAAPDDAILDAAGGAFTVSVNVAEAVHSLQLAANASLAIEDGVTLSIGGAFNNGGHVTLSEQNTAAKIVIETTGASLVGGGTITLTEVNANTCGIYLAEGGALTNVNNTIVGAGSVAVSANKAKGVIDATNSQFALYATLSVNAGLLESNDGARLNLGGTINNAGGVILVGAGSSVELNRATVLGGTLAGQGEILGYQATIDGVTSAVTNTGTFHVYRNRYQTFDLTMLGTIINQGMIDAGGVIDWSAPTTLTGGGTVAVTGTFLGDSKNANLTNVDNTIIGSNNGELGGGKSVLINEAGGVIDGSQMVLASGGGEMINAGLIEATGNHDQEGIYYYGVKISNTTIDNTGTILVAAGSKVELYGADIQGGLIEGSTNGFLATYRIDSVLDGTSNAVENYATLMVGGEFSGTLTVEGAIVNGGMVGVTNGSTLLVGSNAATLSGGGTVTLGGPEGVVKGATSTATLTNVDNLIQGSGQLGDGAMSLVNQSGGTIEATNAAALVVNLGANTLVNAGIIEALGITAQETIAGAVANTGTLEAAGGTLAVDGAVTGSGEAVISAGTLAFTSSFNEAVDFDGTGGELQLAQSQGFTNTVTGFSTSAATSLDLLDIGFVGSGEATFSGTASGGTLSVTDGTHTAHIALAGDFVGDTFTAASDGTGGTSVVATGGAGGPTQLHWLTAVDGLFTDASDWTGGLVPAAPDDAILDAAGGAFTVSVNVAEAVHSLQLAANASLAIETQLTASVGTGTGANAGTIRISDGGTLTVAGALDNTGLIALRSQYTTAELMIAGAGVSLVGGGVITLAETGMNGYIRYHAGIDLAPDASLINVDNTISGAGVATVSVNQAKGVIDATENYQPLYATVGINNGLMESSSGADLSLQGTINNVGGVILAGAASEIVLSKATVEGGTVAGSGSILAFGGTLDGRYSPVTNAGTINVDGFTYFTLLGSIVNEGLIQIRSDGTFNLGGPTTLTGGGTIDDFGYRTDFKIESGLTNVNDTIVGSGTLRCYGAVTNGTGGVIDGGGAGMTLFLANTVLANAGLIESASYYGLNIFGGTIDNIGIILAPDNTRLTLAGDDIEGGTFDSGKQAKIVVVGDVLDGTASAIDNRAALVIGRNGPCTVQGAVVNSGEIILGAASGHGPGPTIVVGAPGLTLSGGGRVELGSTADVINGATAAATLTNAGNVIVGGGQIGDGAMGLVNEAGGTIEANIATPLVIDLGANTLANAGLIETLGATSQAVIMSAVANTGTLEAAGGTLTVDGAVSGSGQVVVSAGTVAFASGFDEAVAFTGSGGDLQLAQSQAFTNTVTGFSASGATTLDLRDIGFAGSGEATFSGTASGGNLTVTDGTHTARIAMAGNYLGDTFTAASDGSGGTSVTAQAPVAPRGSPQAFVSAMAQLGAMAVSGSLFDQSRPVCEPILHSPRAMAR